jgi:hypothetical protein
MKLKLTKGIALLLAGMSLSQHLQAQRLSDYNTIFWAVTNNTIGLSKHTSLWVEYTVRRADFLKNWQQQMPRVGLQWTFNNGVSVMAGYAYIITYPYGDYPAGPHTIPEQRIFEQLTWNDNRGRVTLGHRLRLEQRFNGKVDQSSPDGEVTDWLYTNRARYQLRMTIPLNKPKMEAKTWYFTAYDEIFIGFGPNVNQNVFDQNRFSPAIGYQFNKMFRVDAGCLSQIQQQGGLVGGKQVYQYNTGPIVNVHFTRQ